MISIIARESGATRSLATSPYFPQRSFSPRPCKSSAFAFSRLFTSFITTARLEKAVSCSIWSRTWVCPCSTRIVYWRWPLAKWQLLLHHNESSCGERAGLLIGLALDLTESGRSAIRFGQSSSRDTCLWRPSVKRGDRMPRRPRRTTKKPARIPPSLTRLAGRIRKRQLEMTGTLKLKSRKLVAMLTMDLRGCG